MNNKNLFKQIIITVLLIVIGIILGQLKIFEQIKAGIVLALIFVISLIIIMIDKSEENRKFSKLILGSVVLISFSVLLFTNLKFSNQEKTANKIILKLKDFKSKNGVYPKELEIEEENEKYNYHVDSARENFTISYIVDGWHYKEYSSETDKWIIND